MKKILFFLIFILIPFSGYAYNTSEMILPKSENLFTVKVTENQTTRFILPSQETPSMIIDEDKTYNLQPISRQSLSGKDWICEVNKKYFKANYEYELYFTPRTGFTNRNISFISKKFSYNVKLEKSPIPCRNVRWKNTENFTYDNEPFTKQEDNPSPFIMLTLFLPLIIFFCFAAGLFS